MNRFLTLASTGLFATGLAILPVSAFAQSNAPVGADAKATTTTGVVGSTTMPHKADAGKVVAAPAPSSQATDAKADKTGAKAAVTTAPLAGTTGSAKVTAAPAPSTTAVSPAPKTGG